MRVHQNNSIYKGYRLTAKVVRGTALPQDVAVPDHEAETSLDGGGAPPAAPVFTAVVLVAQASLRAGEGDEYPIPRFVDGGFVYSPAEAVHVAVSHGREIVDALTGYPSA